MLSLVFKIAEFGIEKWFGYKSQKSDDKVKLRKIEADKQKALTNARAYVLGQGAWRFQKMFLVTLLLYWGSVILYSMLWCQNCIIPYAGLDYEWTIAALPAPFDGWANGMMLFLFLMDRGSDG